MSNSDDNGTAKAGFSSFSQLVQVNRNLHKALGRFSELGAEQMRDIAAFIDRARATGQLLGNLDERRSAEDILIDWASRLSASGSDAYSSPPRLAPFARDVTGKSSADAETESPKSRSPDEAGKPQRRTNREIIRLNLAAKRWLNSGMDRGYLLHGVQLARAREVSQKVGFDIDVERFLEAGVQAERSRWFWFYSVTGMVLLALAASLLTYFFRDAIEVAVNRFRYGSEISALATEKEKNLADFTAAFGDNAEVPMFQGKPIRRLAFFTQRIDERMDFAGARLIQPQFQRIINGSNLSFGNTTLIDARFISADIKSVDFSGCTIRSSEAPVFLPDDTQSCADLATQMPRYDGVYPPFSSFLESIADGSDFSGCTIDGSEFSSSKLSEASFSGATINRSIFSGAQLDKANFANASVVDTPMCDTNLNGADFREARHDGKFLDTTAWWLAKWDDADFGRLLARYPVENYRRTETYRNRTAIKEQEVKLVETELDSLAKNETAGLVTRSRLAAAENNLAWHYAVNGDVANGRALEMALRAIRNSMDSYHICDTLAYVLLQTGKTEAAATLYDQMLTVDNDAVSYVTKVGRSDNYVPDPSGGVLYRYRYALEALGRSAEAEKLTPFIDRLGYVATHENALLRDVQNWPMSFQLPDRLRCNYDFGNLAVTGIAGAN